MNRPALTLTASRPAGTGRVELRAAIGDTDTTARTIAGDFVPYGVVGYTSAGPTIFLAGSITAPDDLRRVKLLVQHDQSAAAVGYMTDLTDSETAAHGVWHLPAGTASDEALAHASNNLRDGLSLGVQLQDYSFDADDNLVVRAATLYEVSLVTIPAFEDARVLDVAAARKDLKMNRAQLDAALASNSITREDYDRQVAALNAAAAPAPVSAPTPAPVEVVAAREPQADPVHVGPVRRDLAAAVALTEDHLRAGRPVELLSAALEDITSTTVGATEGVEDGITGADTFLGELWRASNVRRPLIDALGAPKPLTGLRVYGWHWVDTPKVPRYAGEKTPVASNTWRVTTIDAEAEPFAGGWDVERKLIDLGAPGLVDTAFSKAVDDYKLNTEVYVAEVLAAAATVVPEQISLTAALATLGVRAATIGASISFVQFGTAVWAEFVNLTEAEVPWWLRQQGSINLGTVDGNAGGMSFSVNPALDPRAVMAGDSNAATFYEVSPPIRVRAENIPNGGVDLGVFGYAAIIVNDKRALFLTTVAEAITVAALAADDDSAGTPAAS